MDCLCGLKMVKIGYTVQDATGIRITIWACHPEGCGRIYLEGKGTEIDGTWYLAEKNDTPCLSELS